MRKCSTCGQCRGHVDCLRKENGNECEDCYTMPSHSLPQGGDPKHSKKHPEHSLAESTGNRILAATLSTKVPVLLIKKLNSKDISLINKSYQSS